MKIGVYALNDCVGPLKFATEHSACFDLCANFGDGCDIVNGYSKMNTRIQRYAFPPTNVTDRSRKNVNARELDIHPGDRLLIPTGIIFDIPKGYSIRLHARSGLSLKRGLLLGNAEGVIDSDYVEQTYVMLWNVSNQSQKILHGDRICQAELVSVVHHAFETISDRPKQKTNRDGGFGSTGEN